MSAGFVQHITCQCGKRGYFSRRDAKEIIRQMLEREDDPKGHMLNAYRCPVSPAFFHVGHRAYLKQNLNDPTTWKDTG